MKIPNISNGALWALLILVAAIWGFILTNRFFVREAGDGVHTQPRKLNDLGAPRNAHRSKPLRYQWVAAPDGRVRSRPNNIARPDNTLPILSQLMRQQAIQRLGAPENVTGAVLFLMERKHR